MIFDNIFLHFIVNDGGGIRKRAGISASPESNSGIEPRTSARPARITPRGAGGLGNRCAVRTGPTL